MEPVLHSPFWNVPKVPIACSWSLPSFSWGRGGGSCCGKTLNVFLTVFQEAPLGWSPRCPPSLPFPGSASFPSLPLPALLLGLPSRASLNLFFSEPLALDGLIYGLLWGPRPRQAVSRMCFLLLTTQLASYHTKLPVDF